MTTTKILNSNIKSLLKQLYLFFSFSKYVPKDRPKAISLFRSKLYGVLHPLPSSTNKSSAVLSIFCQTPSSSSHVNSPIATSISLQASLQPSCPGPARPAHNGTRPHWPTCWHTGHSDCDSDTVTVIQ